MRSQASQAVSNSPYSSRRTKKGTKSSGTTKRSCLSVTLTGNTFIIQNEDDARNIAIQIASLTKKQQAGYGTNGTVVMKG